MSQSTANELDWKFTQSFGEKENTADVTEGDMVTAVEFDQTGDFLAVGDKAGRIWLFEGHLNKSSTKDTSSIAAASKLKLKPNSGKKFEPLEYKFYSQFQSHDPEFDCLKSLEIEEKINMIKFCPRQNRALFILSNNDKTIKLWKVHEKSVKKVSTMNLNPPESSTPAPKPRQPSELRIPGLVTHESLIAATPRRVYQNTHAYHINSISVNSDGETFLSADDLRINLWNLGIPDQSFNIVDIKPASMEELTEVITSASFHPTQCHTLMYSSSRGTIRLADLRANALCDRHSKSFEVEEDPAQKSFFSEIVSSISDVKFTADGRYILSRDYMTMKVWDVNMESKPVLTIPVHEYLRPRLGDLYENDCIFDKFECAASGDGQRFVCGSYADHFLIYDWQSQSSMMIEASKPPPRRVKPAVPAATPAPGIVNGVAAAAPAPASLDVERIDFGKKILHVAWHPNMNAVAVAGLNNLYLYQA